MERRLLVLPREVLRTCGCEYNQKHGQQSIYITCRVNYFKLTNMKSLQLEIGGWYRRRLRMVIWKQWKKIKIRFQNLMKLGISRFQAMMFSNTRKGFGRTAQSPILSTSISNESLQKAVTYFSQLIIALSVCKLRNCCIPNGTYGGVRRQCVK